MNLRGQTLAKLKSNPELIITYLDSENFKLNKAYQSVLNTQLKPILQATGDDFAVALVLMLFSSGANSTNATASSALWQASWESDINNCITHQLQHEE